MAKVKIFDSRIEAEIVKSLLASNGIMSWIKTDDSGGMRPAMAFSQGVELQVSEQDQEKVMQILDSMNN